MLVAYSDSDSDTQEASRAKRRKVEADPPKSRNINASPPPPPASFHALYATSVRTAAADDPALHGGRTRQVKHVEGNWPSHIYLEWTPSKDHLHVLDKVIEKCRAKVEDDATGECNVHSLLRSSLNVQLPLHISLSAPLTLKTEQKDDFETAVKAELNKCGASSFSVRPVDVSWVSNFDQTRTFLVLALSRSGDDDLNKLLQACNRCADTFDLDLIYQTKQGKETKEEGQDPAMPEDTSTAFHISIAWTLEKVEDLDNLCLDPFNLDELRSIAINFDIVKLKIGNTVTDLKLQK